MCKSSKSFTFIDLFAGIGGFHLAVSSLGGKCVFASEIDKNACKTYKDNFNMNAYCDITKVKEEDIPKHDMLCAGFPCQTFSNAGHKKGFADTRGTLFFEVERILKYHKPKYIMLENVKHLLKHNNGKTWKIIREKLIDLGYVLSDKPIVLSPCDFGIPQNRQRLYIPGIYKRYLNSSTLSLSLSLKRSNTSIYSILDNDCNLNDKYNITPYEEKVLSIWDEFYKGIEIKVYGFPVWIDEFGKTYDYSVFPKWKQDYIKKNRQLYKEHKDFIDLWLRKNDCYNFLKLRDRKFEWQAGNSYKSIWETSVQLRQSGIRCKKTDFFPTLVAMVQTPIVAKYRRRITPREAARLQSFPDSFILNEKDNIAYRQLGNSVNVKVLKEVVSAVLDIPTKDETDEE